jgi:filamentous hemagglutinin family protein
MNLHAFIYKCFIQVCILLRKTTQSAHTRMLFDEQPRHNHSAVLSSLVLMLAGAISPGFSTAEPTGGVVQSGSGSINSTGLTDAKVTTVKQTSLAPLVIHWDSFNVGLNETVNFVQPSDASLAVNRILDSQGSNILGNINANGHVWLINPNGLFFGKNAQVNVGGLVASALDTANPQGFSILNYKFTGNSTATVENQGVINAGFDSPDEAGTKHGGYVALVGHHVKNTGSISTAERGTVALTAGSNIQLQLSGNSLISLSVDQNQWNAMAVNGGVMQADGGSWC